MIYITTIIPEKTTAQQLFEPMLFLNIKNKSNINGSFYR